METECPKYRNNRYLCDKKNNQLQTSSDWTHSLIYNQTLDASCVMTAVTLSQEAMEELDERHYIISFPRPIQVHTVCKHEDFHTLNRSFLATIPIDSSLHAGTITISNAEDKVSGQPVKF
ncbi:unnamed protein product [Euphydryas editha]|uniref:Uncharacterized protein n=1 Tax=Euphydryas editha TaxID=104508 RepID=A0AAU9TT14_EUPED|nr:unnamed protein product [Euphydryas editha]